MYGQSSTLDLAFGCELGSSLIQVFFFLEYVLHSDHYNLCRNIDTLWVFLWVIFLKACSDSGFFCHKSWYKRGIERPRFRAEQEVLHPSFGREDEGLGNEKFRGYAPICDQHLDPKHYKKTSP